MLRALHVETLLALQLEMLRGTPRNIDPQRSVMLFVQAVAVERPDGSFVWRPIGESYSCMMMARLNAWITSTHYPGVSVSVWFVPHWVQ